MGIEKPTSVRIATELQFVKQIQTTRHWNSVLKWLLWHRCNLSTGAVNLRRINVCILLDTDLLQVAKSEATAASNSFDIFSSSNRQGSENSMLVMKKMLIRYGANEPATTSL